MQEKQKRNRKPMRITVSLTSHGKLQRGLFHGKVKELAEYIAAHDGAEYSAIAKGLQDERNNIACRVAYLVKGGYVKTTKESGKVKK